MKIGRIHITECTQCTFYVRKSCLQGAHVEDIKVVPQSCPFNNMTTQVLFSKLYDLNLF